LSHTTSGSFDFGVQASELTEGNRYWSPLPFQAKTISADAGAAVDRRGVPTPIGIASR